MAPAGMQLLRRAAVGIDAYTVITPALYALAFVLFVEYGLPILNVLAGAVILYGFAAFLSQALRAWSRGDPDYGRSLRYHAKSGLAARAFVVLVAALGLWYGVFRPLSPAFLRDAVFVAALAWLPASLIILVETEALLEALNPAAIGRVIDAMGADYLRVVILGGLLVVCGCELAGLAADRWGALPAVYMIMLSLIIGAAVLGAGAARRAGRLGLDQAGIPPEDPAAPGPPREHEFLRQARVIEGSDGVEAAYRWLSGELDTLHAPLAVHRHLLTLARRCNDQTGLLQRGRELVLRAMAEGDPSAALGFAGLCVDEDAAFRLGQALADHALIELADRRGRSDLVVALGQAFCQAYPRDPAGPDHALRVADLLAHRYDDPAGARAFLEAVLARTKDDEARARLRAALEHLAPP